MWLDTGVHQHAFVTLIGRDAAQFARATRERAVLRALRPHLATLLRHHLLAPGPLDAAPAGLTAQERRLCALVAAGLSNREIAVTLSLAEDTVKKYVSRVLTKLDLRSRTQLAARWHADPDPPAP